MDDALRVISEIRGHTAPEPLAPNLAWMAGLLQRHGGPIVMTKTLSQSGKIRASPAGRILRPIRQDEPRLPAKGLRKSMHAGGISCRRMSVGQGTQAHIAYHSGPVPSGEHVHAAQSVDVATGWSERVANCQRTVRSARNAPYRQSSTETLLEYPPPKMRQ